MKKTALVGLAAAGVAVGTVAAGASAVARSRRDSEPEQRRADPVSESGVDGQAFLDHLAEAVRLWTVVYADRGLNDPADIQTMHAFLRSTYPLMHERCRVETVNELSLLFTWEGTAAEFDPVVLMAHMDVVPVEPGTESDWAADPFGGAVVGDELWGRGTLDDKGPLIAVMEAVEHLIDIGFQPERTVIIAIDHDEEIGGAQGAAHVAVLLDDRGVRPWLVIDEGGAVTDALNPLTDEPVALVKVAEKGYLDLELIATGQGGHSSFPPRSSTIGTLAAAIRRLEEHPMPAHVEVLRPFFAALAPRLDPKFRPILANLGLTAPLVSRLLASRQETNVIIRTTTAVTMVSGGVKPNVLPQEGSAVVNFRILPGDSIDSVVDHVQRVVGDHIAVRPIGEMRAEPSRFSSVDSPAWETLRRNVEETFPDAIVAPWILTAATDSRYYADFAGDVYGFAPFNGGMDMLGTIHGTGSASGSPTLWERSRSSVG